MVRIGLATGVGGGGGVPVWPPSSPPGPTVLFADDFATGDLSKWDGWDISQGPVDPPYGLAVVDGTGPHGTAKLLHATGQNSMSLIKNVATALPASGVIAYAFALRVPSGLADHFGPLASIDAVEVGGDYAGTPRSLALVRLRIQAGAAALRLEYRSRGDSSSYSHAQGGMVGIATDAWYPLTLVYDASGADPVISLLHADIQLDQLTDASGDTPAPGMFPGRVVVEAQFWDEPYADLAAVSVADGYQGV